LTETSPATTTTTTSPPLDDVINENDEAVEVEESIELSPRHQPWSQHNNPLFRFIIANLEK
jgi:hypothetical protein